MWDAWSTNQVQKGLNTLFPMKKVKMYGGYGGKVHTFIDLRNGYR
jgi:hypothetical protein